MRKEIAKNDDGPVRKWERRWVLQPNVIDYGSEIWVKKWVCIVYNKNVDQVAYQPAMPMIPQQQEMVNSAYEMADIQPSSAIDASFQRSNIYQRTDSFQTTYYEPTAMIEPPRKRLICNYDD